MLSQVQLLFGEWGGRGRLGPGLLEVSQGPHPTPRFPRQVTGRKAGFWGTP